MPQTRFTTNRRIPSSADRDLLRTAVKKGAVNVPNSQVRPVRRSLSVMGFHVKVAGTHPANGRTTLKITGGEDRYAWILKGDEEISIYTPEEGWTTPLDELLDVSALTVYDAARLRLLEWGETYAPENRAGYTYKRV